MLESGWQRYKTFSGRNLKIGPSKSDCPWQAFPALSYVCGYSQKCLKYASLGLAVALIAGIRLSHKGLPGTNTLSY